MKHEQYPSIVCKKPKHYGRSRKLKKNCLWLRRLNEILVKIMIIVLLVSILLFIFIICVNLVGDYKTVMYGYLLIIAAIIMASLFNKTKEIFHKN